MLVPEGVVDGEGKESGDRRQESGVGRQEEHKIQPPVSREEQKKRFAELVGKVT